MLSPEKDVIVTSKIEKFEDRVKIGAFLYSIGRIFKPTERCHCYLHLKGKLRNLKIGLKLVLIFYRLWNIFKRILGPDA